MFWAIGVGWSMQNGGHSSTDSIVGWVLPNGLTTLTDGFAPGPVRTIPNVDLQMDATLIASSESADGVTSLSFTRPLVTADNA